MIRIRGAEERGRFDHGWLDTRHTFSFGRYYDPRHMGFRALRVINEDWVKPGRGFGAHPHEDMEIVTYVLEGELAHRDSLGNGGHDPGRRTAADDGRDGDRAQRGQSVVNGCGASLPDLDAARTRGPGAVVRAAEVSGRGAAQPAASGRFAGRPGGLAGDPAGRVAVSRRRWMRAERSRTRCRRGAMPGCRCCGAPSGSMAVPCRQGTGRRFRTSPCCPSRPRKRPRSWCSIWPERTGGIRPCLARSGGFWPSPAG